MRVRLGAFSDAHMPIQVRAIAVHEVDVEDLSEAASTASRFIADHGLGSSNWYAALGAGDVVADGLVVARVSYNGRVWTPGGAEIVL